MALFICQACGHEASTWDGKCASCGGSEVIRVNQQTDKMIDRVVRGRFKIVKKLGQGGMGAVYLAEQVGIGHKVALKFLKSEFSSDPELARRFRNEAKSYSLVAHPNAVAYHDFGQDDDGNIFIAMEYCEGNDLKKMLAEGGRFSVGEAIDVVLQVADVLANAHSKGIVHRDLKPENIMIRRGLRGMHAKVLDFGIARLINENTKLTMAGAIAGTPRYMPPEQVQGQEVDHRADIYALGIVLFEMLTGKQPFDGATIAEIMRKQVMEPMPHLSEYAEDLDLPELDGVVQKACAKKRTERYADMSEFAQALSRAIPTQSGMSFLGAGGTTPSRQMQMLSGTPPPGSVSGNPQPGSASGMAVPGAFQNSEESNAATMVKSGSYPPAQAVPHTATPLPVQLGADSLLPMPPTQQVPAKQLRLDQSINISGNTTEQAPRPGPQQPSSPSNDSIAPMAPKSKLPMVILGAVAAAVLVVIGFVATSHKPDVVPVVKVDPPKTDPVKVDPPKTDPVVKADPPKTDPVVNANPTTNTDPNGNNEAAKAVHETVGSTNLALGKTEWALANLESAETRFTGVPSDTASFAEAQDLLSKIKKVRELVSKGNGMKNAGRCNDALPFYSQALAINPKMADAQSGKNACAQAGINTTMGD